MISSEVSLPGGDIYILKNILHDWDDQRSADILASCRRAMAERPSILLIIEYVVRPGPQLGLATIADVHMMVRTGGRNRTEEEWRELLTNSGLRLSEMVPTGGPDIVEVALDDRGLQPAVTQAVRAGPADSGDRRELASPQRPRPQAWRPP